MMTDDITEKFPSFDCFLTYSWLLGIYRNLGKASSETRLFFTAPKSYLPDLSSKFPNGKETLYLKGSLNVRASYFAGQDITGDAILASIGYTRKSRDLFYEDVTIRLYYRSL